MSKIFYDRLVIFEEVETEIDKVAQSKEERDELWGLVDETLHHKIFDTILNKLPTIHHQEFLEKFHRSPHDEALFDYLEEKIGENIEEIIKEEIGGLAYQLLEDLRTKKKK